MRTRQEVYKEFEGVHKAMNNMERKGLAGSIEYYELSQKYKQLEKELMEVR